MVNRHTHTYGTLQTTAAFLCQIYKAKVLLKRVQKTKPLFKGAFTIFCSHYLIIVLFKNTLPHIFNSLLWNGNIIAYRR